MALHVVEIAVGLIVFATLGVAAIMLLLSSSSAINASSPVVATIAVTVVLILAALAVALGFFGKAGHKI